MSRRKATAGLLFAGHANAAKVMKLMLRSERKRRRRKGRL